MVKRKNEQLNIGSAFNMYIVEKRSKGCVKDTIDNSNFALKIFLEDNDLYENDSLLKLNKQLFIDWTNFMLMTNKSPETINAYLSRMRAFINWCISNDFIPYFKISLVRSQEQKIKFFDEDELEILLKRPAKDCNFIEYRTWCICCFVMATGARASTISNIKIEDIHESCVEYRHMKNKSRATIPLSPNMLKIINEYLRTWDIDSEYLFTDQYGNQLTVGAMRQALKKYCTKRGVEQRGRGMHSLRHSFARQWIKAGGGTFQLQTLLCHKSLQMTRHYVQLFSEDLKDDVEEFAPLDNFIKTNKKIKRA